MAEITFAAKTDSGGKVETAAQKKEALYQGINVVSGITPPTGIQLLKFPPVNGFHGVFTTTPRFFGVLTLLRLFLVKDHS